MCGRASSTPWWLATRLCWPSMAAVPATSQKSANWSSPKYPPSTPNSPTNTAGNIVCFPANVYYELCEIFPKVLNHTLKIMEPSLSNLGLSLVKIYLKNKCTAARTNFNRRCLKYDPIILEAFVFFPMRSN